MNRLMNRSNEPTGRRWGWAKNDYRIGLVTRAGARRQVHGLFTRRFRFSRDGEKPAIALLPFPTKPSGRARLYLRISPPLRPHCNIGRWGEIRSGGIIELLHLRAGPAAAYPWPCLFHQRQGLTLRLSLALAMGSNRQLLPRPPCLDLGGLLRPRF